MSRSSFYANLVSKLGGVTNKGPPTVEDARYAELEAKHRQLNAAYSKLSQEHTDLLRATAGSIAPTTQVSPVKHMCRKRELLAVTAEGTQSYSQWSQWVRISKEEYQRDSICAEFAGLRQYRVQS